MCLEKTPKVALIFGIDGQDGSYLGEFLLNKGYKVVGWIPKSGSINEENLKNLITRIHILKGSLEDIGEISKIFQDFKPDEIYNLASPSFAASSWENSELVAEVAGLGVLRILEALRLELPQKRFFQASSSEIFGDPVETPQSELTPLNPRNPYGLAKTFGHHAVAAYRQQYGIFAVSGILFNHESPRRSKQFVTRKITNGAAQIYCGNQSSLFLGNLDAKRDWSFAGDIIRAIWMMLQNATPKDYVIGSGRTHSVRDVCQIAFSYLGLDFMQYVISNEQYFRPRETYQLCADPSKINNELGWTEEVSFRGMIEMMVQADLDKLGWEGKSAGKSKF